MTLVSLPTAPVFKPLLQPARYKGARGGRGSGKSHFFAEMLVEEAMATHIRAACLREVQGSIKDSSKQLIEDKIDKLGVGGQFRITEREIVGPNESLFIFRGLATHTAAGIKSLEGFNRCWIDEAQAISRRSLDIATPTFRAVGAEMRFSWNPVKATDPVEAFFARNGGDADFICVTANHADNPWLPEGLRADMERDRRRDPDRYAHVWLGGYDAKGEARVFRNWKIEEGLVAPKDAVLRFGADWGFAADPTVLVRCWIEGRRLCVDFEAYAVGCAIDATPALFAAVPGSAAELITADSARPETVDYMRRHGFPKIVPAVKGKGSVEDGVEFLKSFDIVVHPRCRHVIDELSSYAYRTDRLTGQVLSQLEDRRNHTIDALRYACEGARRAGAGADAGEIAAEDVEGEFGWMG
jgi:phage terminase large subunit